MAAISTSLFGLLYFLVDVSYYQVPHELNQKSGKLQQSDHSIYREQSFWSGAPFKFLGANPILLYVAQIVFRNHLPLTALYFVPDTHWGHLIYSLWGVTFWTVVAYVFYRRKIFLSI